MVATAEKSFNDDAASPNPLVLSLSKGLLRAVHTWFEKLTTNVLLGMRRFLK